MNVKEYLHQQRENTIAFLSDLIRVPSTRGNEKEVALYLEKKFKTICDSTEFVFIPESIKQDIHYAFPDEKIDYKDRPNLIVKKDAPQNTGRQILFNTHLDVVPASQDWENAYEPVLQGDKLTGRGACDAKGQVTTLYLVFKAINELNLALKNSIEAHFVIEEEVGGNGTLAIVRQLNKADAAIVLEPTESKICSSVRGAVWFEITVLGKPGHSGKAGSFISAFDKAQKVMAILKDYHDDLLSESRHLPLFDQFEDPMPLTFGEINAGDWPSKVPKQALIRGVFGFLPNKNKFEIQKEMIKRIKKNEDEWLRNHCDVKFPMLNSDGNVLAIEHRLVKSMQKALEETGKKPEISAMPASCDAWYYQNIAEIPTIVLGAGSLANAHTDNEFIYINEILKTAETLIKFIDLY